jgi:S1-C subfamily serine protease
MEQLLEAHPELRDKLHVGGLGQRGNWIQRMPRGWQLFDNGQDGADLSSPFASPNVRTDILGVVVQPLTAQESKDAGVDAGRGLRIERVESGTIAASMGLQRGQVLIELNSEPIDNRDDITAVLKKRGADGSLEAVVIDRWGERRTHTWKPDTSKQL